VGVAQGASAAGAAAALIALFVIGVALNVLVSESATPVNRKVAAALGVSLLLTAAPLADSFALDRTVVACLCLAMGPSNAISGAMEKSPSASPT
jgi:uncharacterized membrane protein YoaK (UPF0700 family)